jgi:PAS domain S-box-containing protein
LLIGTQLRLVFGSTPANRSGRVAVTKAWATRVVALLLLVTLVTGFLAVSAAPDDGRVTGIWPVGLATASLFVAGRRWVPHLLVAIGAIAVATIWAGGRPGEVAFGYALGTVLEVLVVWWLLADDDDALPMLRSDRHLARFLGATALGSLVAAVVAGGTAFLADWGAPLLVALAIGTAHLASQLTLLPFFSRLPEHPSIASPVERVIQWLVILPLTAVLFLPHDFPQLVFLTIPLLGWSALRSAPREALRQMLVVIGVAIQLTSFGYGPLASVPDDFGFPVDARGIVLSAFTIACALVVVPLMLTVGQQLENARQAAAERDKVQNIVNAATGIAIIGTDEVGRVTLFNPGAQRLLGYTKDEALGRSSSMFHTEQELAAFAERLGVRNAFLEVARAMTAPGAAATDIRFRRKDGEERTHSMTLTRMTGDRGQVSGYVITSEDITERVTAQQALVEALATETQAVERLREVDQVKDAFVSSVSHELRTPITSIVGYLEMLEEGEFGDLEPEQAVAVRRVSNNSRRLLSLIDELLTLSRVQDDGLGLVQRAFDLREVVRSGHDVVAPAWASRDLAVHLELPSEPVPFVGDKDMLERVVMNLVGNAVKFTPEGGLVHVQMTAEHGNAVVEVRDTGIGIPAQEQDRLFSRFFRSSTAQKQAIPGSGLGLAIAGAIVQAHGGTIECDSVQDVGTTFRVEMPMVV